MASTRKRSDEERAGPRIPAHQRRGADCRHFSFDPADLGNLGLVSPQRTRSKYRLYTQGDVRILKRAQFLRRARGMNAPAIVHLLKTQGLLTAASHRPKAKLGRHAPAPHASEQRVLACAGRAGRGSFRRISQRARTRADDGVGGYFAPPGALLSTSTFSRSSIRRKRTPAV